MNNIKLAIHHLQQTLREEEYKDNQILYKALDMIIGEINNDI